MDVRAPAGPLAAALIVLLCFLVVVAVYLAARRFASLPAIVRGRPQIWLHGGFWAIVVAGLARPRQRRRGRPHALGPRAGARLPALADGLSPPHRPARAHGGHPLLRSPALPLPRLWRHRRALRQGARSSGAARGHERGGPRPLAARRPQAPGPGLALPRSPRADGRAGLRGAARGLEPVRARGAARRGAPARGRAGAVGGGVERALRGARVGRAEDGRAGPRDRRGAPALRLQRLPEHLQAAAGAVAGRVLEPVLLLLQGDAGGLLLLPDLRALLPGPPGPAHARRDPRGRRAREPLLPHRVQRHLPAHPRPARAPPVARGALALLPAAEPGHLRLDAARAAAAGRARPRPPRCRPGSGGSPGCGPSSPSSASGRTRAPPPSGSAWSSSCPSSASDERRARAPAGWPPTSCGLVALNFVLLAAYRLLFVAWFARRAAWGEMPTVLLHGLRLDLALLGLELLVIGGLTLLTRHARGRAVVAGLWVDHHDQRDGGGGQSPLRPRAQPASLGDALRVSGRAARHLGRAPPLPPGASPAGRAGDPRPGGPRHARDPPRPPPGRPPPRSVASLVRPRARPGRARAAARSPWPSRSRSSRSAGGPRPRSRGSRAATRWRSTTTRSTRRSSIPSGT